MLKVGRKQNQSDLKSTALVDQIKIGDSFLLFEKRKLGCGAFGDIYLGLNLSKGKEVALKLESLVSKSSQLVLESRIYQLLDGGDGIPKIHWFGVSGKYNVLAMDLLGKSLEDLFQDSGRKFPFKTAIPICLQIIDRIQFLHNKDYIHRDIKPENFMTGLEKDKNKVFIIDLGLAKRYREALYGTHIPYREGKSLTGTARYASISTHIGIEQSRRDDIESFAYMLIYFLKGSLPWQGLKAKNNKEKYDRIADKKVNTKISVLCAGLPEEVAQILFYARSLKFEEKPDYDYIRTRLTSIATRERISLVSPQLEFESKENKENQEGNTTAVADSNFNYNVIIAEVAKKNEKWKINM